MDRQTLRDWVHRCFPPYSPELNPVENVWQHLRSNWLAISVFEDYDAIVDACCHTCRSRAVSSPACGGGFHLFAEIDPQGRPHAKAKPRPVRTELTQRNLICLGAIGRAGRPETRQVSPSVRHAADCLIGEEMSAALVERQADLGAAIEDAVLAECGDDVGAVP